MKELEVKILEINGKQIQEKLRHLGAEKIFDGEIRSVFFDFADGRIIKANDVLRLRKESDKIDLTYKKVKVGKAAKSAEEVTVEVSSLDETEKILGNLGLQVIDDMQKHRVSYKFGNMRFDMDCYLGRYGFIPELMEIEAENIEEIHKYAALLGYKPKDCRPWSTTELIEHYSSKKKQA
jgi:predicted adenylyl cyclase CyaB